MALVEPQLPAAALSGADLSSGFLTLTAPGMAHPLKVPLDRSRVVKAAAVRPVSVWSWKGVGEDQGDEAAEWVSKFLGLPCRLVRYLGSHAPAPALSGPLRAYQQDEVIRPTEEEFASGFETQFTDGFPALMATQEALDDLNTRLPQPIPMDRFRPNIVLAGGGTRAWEEDEWRELRLVPQSSAGAPPRAPITLSLVKPCGRCNMPSVDQATGQKTDIDPTGVLRTWRSGTGLGYGSKYKEWRQEAFFGWNVVWQAGEAGTVCVGDDVQVVSRKAFMEKDPGPVVSARPRAPWKGVPPPKPTNIPGEAGRLAQRRVPEPWQQAVLGILLLASAWVLLLHYVPEAWDIVMGRAPPKPLV